MNECINQSINLFMSESMNTYIFQVLEQNTKHLYSIGHTGLVYRNELAA